MNARKNKTRIAFVNTHPIQYFAPLYAYLNRDEALSVTAIYLADYSVRGGIDRKFGRNVKWDIDLLSGYEARFVSKAASRGEPAGFWSMIAPEVWQEIRGGEFDAIILHGHTPAANLLALAAAKTARIPVFMRGDTHLGLRRSALKRGLRQPVMRMLYALVDGVLAIGSANAAFYRSFGVPERRIFLVPYAVDNDRFMSSGAMTAAERNALRAGFGVTDARPIILFAGKFQPRKRPCDLLCAAARLVREGRRFHVVMVGSGELEAQLRAFAREQGLNNVHFADFVNQNALPRLYAACDVFALPSQDEPWGLVVNEAMCAGLPVVASREIGCVPDLVHDGLNGSTFATGDVAGLADALRPILGSSEVRRRMGKASRDIVSRWSYAECAQGLKAALASVGLGVRPTDEAGDRRGV